ncbi:L,D-transpeptidase family protein [Ensifer adhaerens]|uniref:L,D-transpeptidase family protein n=1 Tax=Ensifer adhaerens TaxID=106592 RepID=UPI001CBA6CD1|nr:L,D-transpeptidase family protein [Ensifer adhaerens]MBZ7921182.1 L,D-transpeptidase family protein [Ensifer adhaerens]UAX93623.1 L,D-transpeptidase family protein [Ensifer adhaerens]UAY01259.1 L,D-transpeptidase family protein [Ensifer adhaerens]UAY08641.1 L,D-transpeptidase family protein [Ensifer adhaerens]
MVSRFALTASVVALLLSPATGFAGSRGPLQIIVSKDQQSLVVYDGDAVIATSPVSTGKAGHATPTGIFSILEKRRHHKSNIYSNAPMPFMQRLTWSGIALHGSNHVPDYPASHGCVRLPSAFAASLYKMTERGVHVLISDRQITPTEVKSALLFRPAPIDLQPPLSDVPLRPAISQAGDAPVEVAMTEPTGGAAATTNSMAEPIRILITRSDTRDTMREIQMSLELLGYAPGTIDGHAGPATIAALRAFQTSEGLESDGKLTPVLTDKLLRKAGRTPPQNGKILVRQGFKPLFEAGLTIDKPEEALGTHFLQFRHNEEQGAEGKWFGVSLENHLPNSMKKRLGISMEADPFAYNGIQRTLARMTISNDVRERVEELLAEGSSLSIADTESGLETGQGTDFITVTRSRPGD